MNIKQLTRESSRLWGNLMVLRIVWRWCPSETGRLERLCAKASRRDTRRRQAAAEVDES